MRLLDTNLKLSSAIKTLFLMLVALLLLSHIPFLNADSDISISTGSRGAWIDEGLNTIQIRNFINHGTLNLLDCDNFLKTPLFSVFLFPFFKMFGIDLLNARLLTALFTLLPLLFLYRSKQFLLGMFFIVITLFYFPIHQYSHLSLAEMYAVSIIAFSILWYSGCSAESSNRNEFVFYMYLVLSVLFKIQFAYILVLPILFHAVLYLIYRQKIYFQKLKVSLFFFLFIIFLFFIIWYLPFKTEWEKIMSIQSGAFSFEKMTLYLFWHNVKLHFLSSNYLILSILFSILVVFSGLGILRRVFSEKSNSLLLLSFLWVLIETHKIGMEYLPMRYLIGFYFSICFFIVVSLYHFFKHKDMRFKALAVIFGLIFFAQSANQYYRSYNSRTYSVHYANNYFEKVASHSDVMIGPWATVLNWKSKSYAVPIWHGFLQDYDIFAHYKPNFILSEPSQVESDYAYLLTGMDLYEKADSVKQFKIAQWEVNVFRVKEVFNK